MNSQKAGVVPHVVFNSLKGKLTALLFSFLTLLSPLPSALAANGSGTAILNPDGAQAGTANSTFHMIYTAAEAMKDGQVQMTIPASWPAPNVGNMSVTVTNGVTGTVFDSLDSTTLSVGANGWNSIIDGCILGCTVSLTAGTAAGEMYSGAAALEVESSLGVGFPEISVYRNFSAPQDWSSYTHISFYLKKESSVNVSILTDANFVLSSAGDLSSSVSYPISSEIVSPSLLSSGEWTQVIVDLTASLPATRASVQSYGLVFPSGLSLALSGTIRIDEFAVGPADATIAGQVVTQKLLYLEDEGTVDFNYHGITVPSTTGSYAFNTSQSLSVADSLTALTAGSPNLQVVNLVTGGGPGTTDDEDSSIARDIDGDNSDEYGVDTQANGCYSFFYDPDTSSKACLTVDGNSNTCADFFLDTEEGTCEGECPNYFWDATHNILSAVTKTTLTLNGVATEVCAYSSTGSSSNDSYIPLLNTLSTGGTGGTGTNGTGGPVTVGGIGGGQDNPFVSGGSGGGCSLNPSGKLRLSLYLYLMIPFLFLMRRAHEKKSRFE